LPGLQDNRRRVVAGEQERQAAANLSLESIKAFFDVGKQAVLGLVVLAVIFYPPVIGLWIGWTGVAKGKLFGFEWETKLTNTDQELQKAQADKLKLEDQLALARAEFKKQSELLQSVQGKPQDPADSARIASAISATTKILADSQTVINAAQQNSQSAQRTIAANSNLLAQDGAAGSWVLLTGSDTTKAAAQDEVARANAKGYRNARIIHSRSVYRTGILYPDRKAAFDDLPGAKVNLRKDAYVLSMDQFCPNREDKPDLIECGN
jgi:hypothetical protein